MRTGLQVVLILAGVLCLPLGNPGLLLPEAAHGRGGPSEAEAGWRGNLTGLFPKADPPRRWSTTENVIWRLSLSKWSNATPVIHKKLIFVCEEPATLVCIDQRKAKELWRVSLGYEEMQRAPDGAGPSPKDRLAELEKKQGELAGITRELNRQLRQAPQDEELKKELQRSQGESNKVIAEIHRLRTLVRQSGPPVTHGTNGYTSPTPVAAGKRVYVLFGYGGVAAFDLKGKRLWARMVEKSGHGWGHSASPVLTGGTLVVHINQTVHGLDPETGKELWTAKSASTWGTPLPIRVGRERAVLTSGGVLIRVSDGAVVASGIGAMPWTSPIEHEGVIYIVDQAGAFAFRVPEKLEDSTTVERIWQSRSAGDRYYASPVVHDGLLYAINQQGVFSVLDIKDGAVIYEKKLALRGTMYPSITLAGGVLFVSDDQGTTLLLEPGREYKELGSNTLEPFRTTPVFEGKRVYIRTHRHLYCLGED